MLTVEEVNGTFAEKGIKVRLPLPEHFRVKSLDVLERKAIPGGVGLLLSIKFINEQGKEVSDLFFCEGEFEGGRRRKKDATEIKQPPKSQMLPHRSLEEFESDDEVRDYLAKAMGHLLEDKGYRPGKAEGVDLYFEDNGQGFYLSLAVRCDDAAIETARKLADLRLERGVDHDYGLVVPAFQESLGVSLLNQDRWLWRHQEYLAASRVGVYAVDNWNPNLVYAFSIHPQPREMKRYFMITGSQWQMVRSRYVAGRSSRRREKEL